MFYDRVSEEQYDNFIAKVKTAIEYFNEKITLDYLKFEIIEDSDPALNKGYVKIYTGEHDDQLLKVAITDIEYERDTNSSYAVRWYVCSNYEWLYHTLQEIAYKNELQDKQDLSEVA